MSDRIEREERHQRKEPESADDLRDHSIMLGQIAAEVEEWCISEECTTLDAVRLALADLRKWRGIAERFELEKKYWA